MRRPSGQARRAPGENAIIDRPHVCVCSPEGPSRVFPMAGAKAGSEGCDWFEDLEVYYMVGGQGVGG